MRSFLSSCRLARPLLLLGSCGGLLSGCGASEAELVPLSALAGRTLQAIVTDVDSLQRPIPSGSYRLTVLFSAGDACVRLSEQARALLDGAPMTLEPGALTGSGGRQTCQPPRATFDFDPAQWGEGEPRDARVVLSDDTHQVQLLLRGARAKRRFVRADSPGTTLRRGQVQTYVWQPAADAVAQGFRVSLTPTSGGLTTNLPVEQEGVTGRFLVPEASNEGEYVLRLDGNATLPVVTCEGVAGCSAEVVHSEEVAVVVAR
jgi:hypothetical protein